MEAAPWRRRAAHASARQSAHEHAHIGTLPIVVVVRLQQGRYRWLAGWLVAATMSDHVHVARYSAMVRRARQRRLAPDSRLDSRLSFRSCNLSSSSRPPQIGQFPISKSRTFASTPSSAHGKKTIAHKGGRQFRPRLRDNPTLLLPYRRRTAVGRGNNDDDCRPRNKVFRSAPPHWPVFSKIALAIENHDHAHARAAL